MENRGKEKKCKIQGYFATEIVQECRGREEELQSIRKIQESPINIYEKHMEMQRVSKEMQLEEKEILVSRKRENHWLKQRNGWKVAE